MNRKDIETEREDSRWIEMAREVFAPEPMDPLRARAFERRLFARIESRSPLRWSLPLLAIHRECLSATLDIVRLIATSSRSNRSRLTFVALYIAWRSANRPCPACAGAPKVPARVPVMSVTATAVVAIRRPSVRICPCASGAVVR